MASRKRGWRPPPTEAERLAAVERETTRIIKTAMILNDIKYDIELADKVGICRATLSAKFRRGAWTQEDLCKIVAALKIPADDAMRMIGIGVKV